MSTLLHFHLEVIGKTHQAHVRLMTVRILVVWRLILITELITINRLLFLFCFVISQPTNLEHNNCVKRRPQTDNSVVHILPMLDQICRKKMCLSKHRTLAENDV